MEPCARPEIQETGRAPSCTRLTLPPFAPRAPIVRKSRTPNPHKAPASSNRPPFRRPETVRPYQKWKPSWTDSARGDTKCVPLKVDRKLYNASLLVRLTTVKRRLHL